MMSILTEGGYTILPNTAGCYTTDEACARRGSPASSRAPRS
jgi:thiazole synthase ThiGH ThiG subunit